MTFRITEHTQTRSAKGLTMPEPIDFDFDEMVKAKAKADAEFRREVERRVNADRNAPRFVSEKAGGVSESTRASKYEYDLNLAAELTALTNQKRKKKHK